MNTTILLVMQMLLGSVLLLSGLIKLTILLFNYSMIEIPPARGLFPTELSAADNKRNKIISFVTGVIYLLASIGLLIPAIDSDCPAIPTIIAFCIASLMPLVIIIDRKEPLSIYLNIIILLMAASVGYERLLASAF